MKRFLLLISGLLVFLNMFTVCQAETADIMTFGIVPYFSAAKLMELHNPLKEHLADSLNETVSLISAPNFKKFRERTHERQYDLVFTAPHMARLAELEDGYQRVVMSTHRGRPIFLVKQDSTINTLEDLKGKKIALPPPKAINHHVALKGLKEHGLEAGKTVTIIVTPSHSSALLSVLNDQVAVAVMGKSPWGTYKKKYKDQVKVLATSYDFPGFIIMAHPSMSSTKVRKIKESLLSFAATEQGKAYLRKTALEGLSPIDDKTMIELDPYVQAIFGGK